MLLVLAIFSNVVLFAAAWTSVPSSSVQYSNGCSLYRFGRSGRLAPIPPSTQARALITSVALTSKNIFAKAEDSPLPSSSRRQLAGENLVGGGGGNDFRWTPLKILQATVIFVLAGIAEIGGGWLVWKAVRENKPWWWAVVGSAVMVVYAFLPTLQPTDSFGRIYAVYGGFFIGLSYVWGWLFDGMKPDTGDVVGGCLALLAVLIIQYWPRQQ